MKAAIYARYSSDKQSTSSIEDQERNCRRLADKLGLEIAECYRDRALSGARRDRPDYQRMLADAETSSFEVLLIDDLSRLSRDDVAMKQVIRRFNFLGIRIVGASEGFDTHSKGHKIQAGVRGLINEIYLDDLKEKTHRGLTGQAIKGNNCGGRSYGYRHIPQLTGQTDQHGQSVFEAVRREIDEGQAETIVRIFENYASGLSPRTIASELNREAIPAPRGGTWSSSAIYGHPKKAPGS